MYLVGVHLTGRVPHECVAHRRLPRERTSLLHECVAHRRVSRGRDKSIVDTEKIGSTPTAKASSNGIGDLPINGEVGELVWSTPLSKRAKTKNDTAD